MPAGGHEAASSRFSPVAGTSRDGRRNSTDPNLKIDNFLAGRGALGLRRTCVNLGEE
jgi:hypothetical protein